MIAIQPCLFLFWKIQLRLQDSILAKTAVFPVLPTIAPLMITKLICVSSQPDNKYQLCNLLVANLICRLKKKNKKFVWYTMYWCMYVEFLPGLSWWWRICLWIKKKLSFRHSWKFLYFDKVDRFHYNLGIGTVQVLFLCKIIKFEIR